MSSFIDLTGKRFGRLVILSRDGSYHGFALWKCQCDCGNITITRGTSLRSGATQSCGCFNREQTTKRLVSQNTTHGLTGSSEYHAYYHAKKRCMNPNDIGWKDYGGRGIKFLIPSFEAFIEKIGKRPSPKYSLDRQNNDGNYTLENIRWATKSEQMANRREYATTRRICCAHCGSREFKRLENMNE